MCSMILLGVAGLVFISESAGLVADLTRRKAPTKRKPKSSFVDRFVDPAWW